MSSIAALFVETGGSYFNLPGVDAWDQARDARKYHGPHPVVAQPIAPTDKRATKQLLTLANIGLTSPCTSRS